MRDNFGTRIAQSVTFWIGTWTCVIGFLSFEAIWMTLNGSHVMNFDPAPFILLNLGLSTWAGIQGSIIMINQKYQQKISDESDKKRDEILSKLLDLETRQMEMYEHQQSVKGLFKSWLK